MELENNLDSKNDSFLIKQIIDKCRNHPTIKAIEDAFLVEVELKIDEAMVQQVNRILRNIDRPDKIPPKIVKIWANIINSHLTNIIDSDLS